MMHVISCAKALATMIAVINGSCFEVALVSLVPRESMDLCEIYKEKDDYISLRKRKCWRYMQSGDTLDVCM